MNGDLGGFISVVSMSIVDPTSFLLLLSMRTASPLPFAKSSLVPSKTLESGNFRQIRSFQAQPVITLHPFNLLFIILMNVVEAWLSRGIVTPSMSRVGLS
jgi:hypothetical protein